MRSQRKTSKSGGLLAGAFVLVIAVAGTAFWLLDDGAASPTPPRPTVRQPDVEDHEPMRLPPAPEIEDAAATRLELPGVVQPDDPQTVFEPEAGTPRGSIVGLVVDQNEQPVPDVDLRIYKGNPLMLNVNFVGTRQVLDTRALSDAAGRFVLPDVPVGKDYVLVGVHSDFARTELVGLQVRMNRAREDVILRLEDGATVKGTITTVPGAPLAEARVELYDAIAAVQLDPDQRRPWKIVFTDSTGAYEFKHVSATSLKVRVEAAGYESQSRMLSFALDARASDRQVDFQLKVGHSLPGRVVDDRGRGVPQARLEATSLTKDYQGTSVAHSDANGYFLLDGMGDQYYQVRATAKGFSNKVQPKVHIDDGELTIEMEQRLLVEGWVVDHAGAAVTSFSLTLMRATEGRDPLFLNDSRKFQSNEGHFEFDNLDPGSYALEARAPGFSPSWSESFLLARSSEEPPPQLTIRMGPGGTLTGMVYDHRGDPVENALVRLNPNNHLDSPIQGIFSALGRTVERKVQTRTNSKGRYVLANLRAGTYQVACSHTGSAPKLVNDVLVVDDMVGSNPSLDITLPPGSTIGGLAMDHNQRIIPFCEIQITNKKTAFLDAATTDSAGTFAFGNLAEGTYTLMVKPDRIDKKPINPLMKLMYAQRSQQDVFVSAGQSITDVELFLPSIPQN